VYREVDFSGDNRHVIAKYRYYLTRGPGVVGDLVRCLFVRFGGWPSFMVLHPSGWDILGASDL
jgi:hypothetical protein